MSKHSFTLPARSLVLTEDGFKKASDIDTGDFVIGSDGATHPVTEIGNGGPLNCASVRIGNDERHLLSGDKVLASCFSKNGTGVMSMEPAAPKCPHDLTTPEPWEFDGAPIPPFAVDSDSDDDEPPSFDYVCSPDGKINKAFEIPKFTDYELWLLGLYASDGTSSTYVIDNERITAIEFDADSRVSKDLLLLRHIESMGNATKKVGIKTETSDDMEHASFHGYADGEKSFAYRVAQMYGPKAGSRQIGAIVPDEYRIDWLSDSIGIPVGTLFLDDGDLDKFLEGYCQDFSPLGGIPRSGGVPCRSLADALMLRLLIHKRYGCRAFLRHGGQVTVTDEATVDEIPTPTHTYDMWFVSFDSTDADGADYANAFDGDDQYMAYCVSRAGTERTSDECVEVVADGTDTVIQDSLIVFGQELDYDADDDEIDEIDGIDGDVDDGGCEIDEVVEVIDSIDMDDDDDDDDSEDGTECEFVEIATDIPSIDVPAAIRKPDVDE